MNSGISAATNEDSTAKLRASHIVGIGSSAGGLEALQHFFSSFTENTGMAFVIIQHLSPDFKCLTGDLLGKYTALNIVQVHEPVIPQPNTIYLLRPGQVLTMEAGQLLTQDHDKAVHPNVINTFFSSLAKDQGIKAIAVILSGTGSDGSQGIMEIDAAGGRVLVQSPETAAFDAMPTNAIAKNVADAIAAPEELTKLLLAPVMDTRLRAKSTQEQEFIIESDMDQDLLQLFRYIDKEFGLDLNAYKHPTLLRRLERRMVLGNIDNLPAYLAFLKSDSTEPEALYKDLLISVSTFYRDPEAFLYLENELLPSLLERCQTKDELRIWVAACSTGEEVYSLAISLLEQGRAATRQPKFKIFATDINAESLKIASEAIYSAASLISVPAHLLAKYFEQINTDQYRLLPEIRKLVVFSRHNLLADTPYHKIDLVSCRNLLIYLHPTAQKRVLSSLYFALNPDGFLWLGPSETLGDLEPDFTALNNHWKCFQKTGMHKPSLNLNPIRKPRTTTDPGSASDPRVNRLYDLLLGKHMPPSILIDEKRQLLHVFGNASQYLHPPQGRVSQDLVQILNPGLKTAVTTLIHSAFTKKQDVTLKNIQYGEEPSKHMDLSAEYLPDSGSKSAFLAIQFIELAAKAEQHESDNAQPFTSTKENHQDTELQKLSRNLEKELHETQMTLQTLMEEMDSTSEDLQTSNEELIASNEELQSANEELYSLNEELYNINTQLQNKNHGLAQSKSDINNLLEHSNTGIIITDEAQKLRLYTPQITRIFNILTQDIGRPISHLTSKIADNTLDDALALLEPGLPAQKKTLATRDGQYFLRSISAYTNLYQQLSGYIIVYTDITAQENAKLSTIKHEQHLRQITDSLKQLIWVDDAQGNNLYSNLSLQRFTGMSLEELKGLGYQRIIHPLDRARVRKVWNQCLLNAADFEITCRYLRFDNVYRWFRVEATPINDDSGNVVQWIGSCTDITESKGANENLSNLIHSAPLAIIIVDERGIIAQSNRQATLWFGYTESELIDQPATMLLDSSRHHQKEQFLNAFLQTASTKSMDDLTELDGLRKSGEKFPIEIGLSPLEIIGKPHIAVFINDLTLRNQAEATLKQVNDSLEHAIHQRSNALIESQNRLKQAAQAAHIGIFDLDLNSGQVNFDKKMFEITGIPPTQNKSISFELWRTCVVPEDLAAQDKILEDVKSQGRTDYSSMYRIKRYDTGELRYISSNRSVVLDEQGNVVRIVGIIRDITDSHLAESALRELTQNLEEKVRQRTEQLAQSEDRFRRMADSSPVLFWIGDQHGRMTWANTTWTTWTGRTMEEQLTNNWLLHIHPDDLNHAQTQLESHFSTGEDLVLEYRMLNASGTYGWLFHQGSALLNDQNEIEGFIATCTDITWQRERSEEQNRIERKIEETTKLDSLGLMAGGVAHDFNNLLTGILGNIELAQWETSADQEMLKTVLHDARSATLRAADLCKQMLAYSGKGQFITENCDVNGLVRETLRFIQSSIKDDVKVFTEFDPSLPAILADKVQLQQIVMNLTINAGESIPEKGSLWIRTGVTRMELEDSSSFVNPNPTATGPAIFLEVEDTGVGMTTDEIKKIFEPFYSTKFIGRGLGLSAVQGIIKGHHGQLIINSIKGAGTLMRVVLPLQQQTVLEQSPEQAPIKKTSWINRVLIVDDEEIVARILQRYLDHMCISADYVLNGKDCISQFITNPKAYDLVILDLTMAGMDGFETFRQIRKFNQSVKVLLISGFTEKEATRQFNADDLSGFLPKPISEKSLVDMINRLKD